MTNDTLLGGLEQDALELTHKARFTDDWQDVIAAIDAQTNPRHAAFVVVATLRELTQAGHVNTAAALVRELTRSIRLQEAR